MNSSWVMAVQVVFGLGAAAISFLSWQKVRRNQFYSDTFLLLPWGVFVWGDGLILGPFWLLVTVLSLLFNWSPFVLWQGYWVFFALRFAYETIYWINHQVANKNYRPPLFRRFSIIGPQEAGILYQLLTMCSALTALMIAWFSGR